MIRRCDDGLILRLLSNCGVRGVGAAGIDDQGRTFMCAVHRQRPPDVETEHGAPPACVENTRARYGAMAPVMQARVAWDTPGPGFGSPLGGGFHETKRRVGFVSLHPRSPFGFSPRWRVP